MTFAWTASNGFQESVNGDVKNYGTNDNLIVNGVRSSKGVVQNTSANGAILWGLRGRTVNTAQNEFTIGAAFQIRDLSADNPDVFVVTNPGFYQNRIGFVASKIQASTTNANTTVDSNTWVSVGDWVYVVYVLQNGNFQLYVNGVKQTAVGTGTIPVQTAPYNYVDFNPSRVNLLTTFAATRPWSQAEVTSWTNNPWQIFEAPATTALSSASPLSTLVVQSSPGTTALNGTAPDPTNVPGNTWVAGANVKRRASGGAWIPDTASDYQTLSYNLATARQQIYATNIVTLDNGIYVRALLNKDASGSAPFGSGTGYALIIRPGFALAIASWSGSSSPTTLAVSAGTIPNSAFTISTLVFEHLTSGTLNASVTIGATTYTATATVGSPLTGTWIGFANSSGVAGGISADLLRFETNVAAYEARITWAEAQYQSSGVSPSTDYSEPLSRGIFRGIERGVA
jgi:hypothetical protein